MEVLTLIVGLLLGASLLGVGMALNASGWLGKRTTQPPTKP